MFLAELEENVLSAFEEKPMISWRYINDIFLFGNMEKNLWKKFLNELKSFHPTIKFTAEYSKEIINFLDVNIRLVGGGGAHGRFVC